MKTRIITFWALLVAALGCKEKIEMDFPYKENIIILAELNNYTENIKVIVRKTFPVSTKTKTTDQWDHEEEKMQKTLRGVKIRVFGGDDEKNKTLITDKFAIKIDRTFSKNKEYEYYLSEKIIPVSPGRYYWLEVEYGGKTYLTNAQKMKSNLKNVKTGIYKSGKKRYFRIFFDESPEVNFYRLEHQRIEIHKKYSGSKRIIKSEDKHHGTFSDVMISSKEQVYLIFDRLDLDEVESGDGINYSAFYDFVIKNMDYPTYNFLRLVARQDDPVSGGSPAFATVPANLTGNIYEKQTKKPTIGNFSVISITKIRKTPAELKK